LPEIPASIGRISQKNETHPLGSGWVGRLLTRVFYPHPGEPMQQQKLPAVQDINMTFRIEGVRMLCQTSGFGLFGLSNLRGFLEV
jgi:hypothetical protein